MTEEETRKEENLTKTNNRKKGAIILYLSLIVIAGLFFVWMNPFDSVEEEESVCLQWQVYENATEEYNLEQRLICSHLRKYPGGGEVCVVDLGNTSVLTADFECVQYAKLIE